MKIIKYLYLLLLLTLMLPGCFHQKQYSSPNLATFYQKADLNTERIYQRLVEKNQLDQEVSLFIKCNECSSIQQDSLQALRVKINQVNGNIVTARIPVSAIPVVAELSFVTALESAKAGKLK